MSEDRYRSLRDLPFPVLAQVLGVDIGRFRLRKGGAEYSGPCIFHNPRRNGTSFSYASNGAFQCFSCSEKGKGAIDAIMKARGIGFQAAVELLEPFAGNGLVARPKTQVKRPEVRQVEALPTENPPFKGSYEKFFKPHAWLDERGLEPETLEHFGSGYYENPTRRSSYNGSLMLRIRRWGDGECVGYLSRNVGEVTPERPKYRFPEGFQKSLELFGAYELKEENKLPIRVLYLVESPLAVMAFHQKGFPAVSPFGWSLSPEQIAIVAGLAKGVVWLPDRDKSEAIAPFTHALSKVVWTKCPDLPGGVEDPEYLTPEQIRALT